MGLQNFRAQCALSILVLGVVGCGSSQSPSDSADAGASGIDGARQQTIYSVANGCYALDSEAGSVTLTTAEDDYTLTDDPEEAARFYLKPTALGSYLLLSRYERVEGTAGQKQLLGITDPGGEFLDAFGNFIGEVGFLVSGVGDITQILVDVIDSGSGPVRDLGETIGDLGGNLGDINVSPTLAVVDAASDLAVWNLLPADGGRFSLTNAVTGQRLAAAQGVVALTNATTAGVETAFRLRPVADCDPYPEVSVNAELLDARG
ncbi:MAG: hypothetical protein ACX94A_12120, partial [Algiphilus sp.]